MFTQSVRFYDALYHFKDYGAASRQLHALLQEYHPNAGTLLDVACGTGKHLEHLRGYYHVEGLDINPEMLDVARQRCPEVPLHQGSMVEFSVPGLFDVVACLFSSIGYVQTVQNMERAVASMTRHLRPGGVLVVEPWFSPETYYVGRTTANFVNESELKIAWMYTSEVEGTLSVFNIHYLVGTPHGVDSFVERHALGLFTHEEYVGALQKVGLDVSHDPQGLFGRGMYIGVKRDAST